MEIFEIKDMKGGWIAGNFEPTIIPTRDFEIAIKEYKAGDREPAHHHKIAEEYTAIIEGRARMCDRVLLAGQVVRLAPGESTSFEAIENTITVVIKRPSLPNDKYLD